MRLGPGRFKVTLLQALAIAGLLLIFGMIVHKAHADISVLARQYSGEEFRAALARYFINNLAGGANPASK